MTRYGMSFVCALMAACSGATDGDVSPEEEVAFTDTIVTIDADGQVHQSVIAVTAEQRRAEVDALEKATVTGSAGTAGPVNGGAEAVSGKREALLRPNSTCAGADLWVYDESRANRLCISGAHLEYGRADTLDFGSIRYGSSCLMISIDGSCLNRWAGKVSWIWPGSNPGGLSPTNSFSPWMNFNAWGPLERVDPATSEYLWLWTPHPW
jgi:hypothetical protein